ncbi:MAG: glucose 1-dehydrogenase [Chitinophagaceae bacterium]|nr:glucose 1-dehydrogenase [Chitinophagaceae bacterium]
MFQLTDKTAIITGAGSGIGRAIAGLFARQGASVFVFDLNEDAAALVVNEITSEGGKAEKIIVDVASQQKVKLAVEKVVAMAGGIDILVNNAGVAHVGNADNTSEADFDRLVSINVKGVYNCLHEVLPLMKKQSKGTILNLCSIAAWVGLSDRFAYSMSKGAVAAMTLSVAKDYLEYHIRCNSISPARVFTPFVEGFIAKNYPGQEKEMFEKLSKSQPIGRMASTDEVASLALYLCSDEAGFITGCDYPLDGGFIKLNN